MAREVRGRGLGERWRGEGRGAAGLFFFPSFFSRGVFEVVKGVRKRKKRRNR